MLFTLPRPIITHSADALQSSRVYLCAGLYCNCFYEGGKVSELEVLRIKPLMN